MPITRLNYFVAKPYQQEGLVNFLREVIGTIEKAQGCISCRLLVNQAQPLEAIILEEWESIESHQAAAKLIPQERIMSVMNYLQVPPRGHYLTEKV